MQRYAVNIVSPGTVTSPTILMVPFEPSALVSAFLDELFNRLSRQNIPLQPNTHVCTLHLDSETGAIIDCEDILGDVILPGDGIFAVFSSRPKQNEVSKSLATGSDDAAEQSLSVRVITPALAKRDKSELQVLNFAATITMKELHDQVADHLLLPRTSASIDNECNCTLAKQVSDGPSSLTSFVVIHGKSTVRRINFSAPSAAGIHAALREHFGEDVATSKHVAFHGAELSENAFDTSYVKVPVVALCAKHRHTPQHARVTHETGNEEQGRTLDLHTSEAPIDRACQNVTLKDSGLAELAVDGIIDIYAVNRATTKTSQGTSGLGKSAVFRYRSHWEPSVKQSDRGIAMMLSSLRVFASNVQEMEDRHKDAIYHVFDLLSSFPPAFRTLHLLIEGKTVNPSESSALSHTLFEIPQSYIPTEIIGTDGTRLFGGARLLFGFIVEKARSLKLSEVDNGQDANADASTPYLTAFSVIDAQDFKTMEPVMHVVLTTEGIVERSLFEALNDGGVLSESHLRSELMAIDSSAELSRVALLGGAAAKEYTTFSVSRLANNYCYPDNGQITSAFDPNELTELEHVSSICGRIGFAVHRPAQLASAVAPYLTFDRNAHLAVYNGPQASSMPGDESGIFRPKHGNEAMDATVVEQLITPILSQYEADGSAVFDMSGNCSTVRRLQAPEEICVFAVDVSASMKSRTDFADVNEEYEDLVSEADPTAETLVEGHFFTHTSLDDVKELLSKHESFDDMVAIVADATGRQRQRVARQVIELVRIDLSQRIVQSHLKVENLENLTRYGSRIAADNARVDLDKAKAFWAALKTHETPLVDFLVFRGAIQPDVATRWMWYVGQSIPAGAPAGIIPALAGALTAVPDGLQCPISHNLMEDAVTAADGLTYSRSAISHWFTIRKSSPMTGLDLEDTTLRTNDAVSASVAAWIMGNDTQSRPAPPSDSIKLTFKSRIGSFERDVDSAICLNSLYRLVFSGLKARFTTFQLVQDTRVLTPCPTPLNVSGLKNGDEITIRLADDGDMVVSANGIASSGSRASDEMCLIKVYDSCRINSQAFSYWVKRDTALTMSSVLFRFWRFKFSSGGLPSCRELQVWTYMKSQGDGFRCGTPHAPSDPLAESLNYFSCSGRLTLEPLFYEDSDQDTDSTQDLTSPLVLKVCISSVWNKQRASRQTNALSRLDVLKQMFEALVNRMCAYNFKNHVGLITFASKAEVTNPISHVLENFRMSTARMSASGDTALIDALALSLDQILEYGKQYPDAKRRIIVISDGNNTKSSRNTFEELAFRMRDSGVAVDTVCIGSEQNRDLKALSWILGCYTFHPTSLANALAICEMEPFLSLTERPDVVSRSKATRRITFTGNFLSAKFNAKDTIVTGDHFPARKEHQSMSDDFVQLSAKLCPPAKATTQPSPSSTFRITRVMKEIKQMATRDHPQYDVYVSESNLTFWKVVLSGPSKSPYSAGTFLLSLDMGERYPTFHPEARFITKMWHPNINAHGRVCHPLFGRDWTTDTSLTTCLDTIYGLLFQAEVSDPVSTISTLEYHADGVEFADAVRDHVSKHAMKSRKQWRLELTDEIDEEMSGDGDEDDTGAGEDEMPEGGEEELFVDEDEDLGQYL